METPENFCSRRVSESPVGAYIPPPHEGMVHGEDEMHGTRPEEVVKFDVLSDGEIDLLGSGGLDDGDPIQDNLLIDDDLSDFEWLESVESNTDATQGMLKEEMCDVHLWVGLVPAVRGHRVRILERIMQAVAVLLLRGAIVRVEMELYGVDDIHCSRKAAVSLKRRKFTREGSPEMTDVV